MAVSKRCPSDHHGPLVPPPSYAPDASAAALDEAVVTILNLQRDCWLSVVTDGELRRSEGQTPDPIAEARFIKSNSGMLIKIRLPRLATGAIADPETLQALLDLGVRYIQLDGAAYGPLIHRAGRAALKARGTDPDQTLQQLLALDSAALSSIKIPEEAKLAVCFHDIADTSAASFQEDLDHGAAETALRGLPVRRFLFDCGTGDADDFSFLSLAPVSSEIVLCLIDQTLPQLPKADDLVARVDAAAEVVDTDRFSLSPRFGFYLAAGEDQAAAWRRQKETLDLVLDASSRAWGIDF